MKPPLGRFARDESGATAIQYTLIATGISVAILAAVQALVDSVTGLYNMVAELFAP